MKLQLTIFLLLIVGSADVRSESDCVVYAKKAVACYELGSLAKRYDESGQGCGNQGKIESFIWTVEPSSNASIRSDTLTYREYGYMGGWAWESTCEVNFRSVQGKLCSFKMLVNLTTEDADIEISEFQCR